MTSIHHRLALFAIFACAPTIAFAQADRIVGEPASTSLLVEPTDGIVHRPIQGNLTPARFSASRDAGATNQSENIVAYDEEPIESFRSGPEGGEIANAFVVPFNTRLSSVYFAGVFTNELDVSMPNDAPRDYRVIIRARGADGLPGQELFSMEVQEPVNGRHVTDYNEGTYEPVKIDLPAEDPVLSSLPENIYIGIGNAGSDQNYVGLAFAHRRSTIDNVYPSYWYGASATWQAFAKLRSGDAWWGSFVHPIRAGFTEIEGTGPTETTVAYEEGPTTLFFVGGEQTHIANAFVVPPNARLSAIYYAGIFNNEFTDGGPDELPNDAPRDYRVIVWDREADGFPGQELFSMEVQEPVNGRHITLFAQGQAAAYVPAKIALPPEDPTFSSLPDSILIGIGNAGTDRNYLGVLPAPRSTSIEGSLSYWHDTISGVTRWWAMEDLGTQGGSLADFVHPIRARFIIPVSTVDPDELPTAVDLQQNYPNPFNPTTSIGWSLAAASPVRLSVHNVLGQRVATLVDGIQPAGTYETRLDASGWASGVYVYVLETGTQTLTRRMVVLK